MAGARGGEARLGEMIAEARLEGKADIWTITVTLDDDGPTQLPETAATRSVAHVQYFNLAGQEVTQPSGLTIRLTTYSDGTTSVDKCMK